MIAAALLGGPLQGSRSAWAGSYVTTIQPDEKQTDDSYLREDGVTEKNGDKGELRLKAASDPKNRNIVVRIPFEGLANKTILQAWLKLTQSAGNSSTVMESRVYPLDESWSEPSVSWRNRSDEATAIPWSTPGGTRGPKWTDRKLVSEQGVGAEVSWQVGPILAAWNLGTLPSHGLLIEPTHGAPDREAVFRSSETGTATQRPKLIVHYTDEAPAVRAGTAEVQPRILRTGATNARLTLWLEVDASGTTPTGAATGLNQITLAHGGTLVVTAIDGFQADGLAAIGSVTFTDNGSSVTIRCPRLRNVSRIRIDLRATVLSGPTPNGVDLPVTVDDTTTPGAWAQALWAGDADGVKDNGDDWVVFITDGTPAKIHVVPDSAHVIQRQCTWFALNAEDSQGDLFTVEADSFRVVPPIGTITRDGQFCAVQAGKAEVIAYWGALSDTAVVLVSPALTPQISPIQLQTLDGTTTNALAPADTMFLSFTVKDGDGFGDVQQIDFELSHTGYSNAGPSPAHRAAFRWKRTPTSTWTLVEPAGTSWKILPSLCSIDAATTSTSPQPVRLAFVTGAIARASDAGEWKAAVRVLSDTPADTTIASRAGMDALVRVSVSARDVDAAFSSGQQGALHLPLARPTDGHVELRVLSNAPWTLSAAATDLAGATSPSDTMFVRAPNQRIEWATNPAGTGGGYLDVVPQPLTGQEPAATAEIDAQEPIHLWINHPPGIPAQNYQGTLELRVDASGAPASLVSLPLTATVVSGGQAAQSVLAEVVPHAAPAGTTGMPFDVYLLPQFQGTDTGINHILIDLPDGYGAASVTSVEVSGAPVGFTDNSGAAIADVTLGASLMTSALVHLRLLVDVPTTLDPIGSGFVVLFDDSGTPLLPQAAIEGNANNVPDGNSWMVTVVPGPLASLDVTPSPVTTYIGSGTTFTAAGYDAYGHAVTPSVAWSVEGGIGSITAGGSFLASAIGSGLVIAQAGSISDTAFVTVWKQRAIAVRSVRGPPAVFQGQTSSAFVVRIENLGGVPVALDTLQLSFSRALPGDADGDFVVTPSSSNDDTLQVGAIVDFAFSAEVSSDALTGPLSVNARASGVEVGPGLRLGDAGADTTLALDVRLGGFELTAQQASGTAHPGASLVPLLSLRLRNLDPEPHTLQRLMLTNRSSGPGDSDVMDASLGDVSLFLDDGDGLLESSQDTLLVTTTALEGRVHMVPLHLTIGAGAERRMIVTTTVPLHVRDGDALDLAVLDPDDLEFERKLGAHNPWPLDPSGALTIDGMVSEQVLTVPEGPGAIPPGAANVPVFRFRVPPNGYVPDVLYRLGLINLGTARPDTDLVRIRAWVDDDESFVASQDRLLGTLLFTGDRWQLSGLSEPVGIKGLWVVVTVDLSPLAEERRTIQLALPNGLDPGLGLSSNNTGPLDKPVTSPQAQTVGDVDRVTLTAMPLESGVTRPGDPQRLLLHLVATNSYAFDRTLRSLSSSNVTTGPGTLEERDRELQLLVLRADGDGDGVLEDVATDPVLATGFFQSGRAEWSGLSWRLPALSAGHLWITGDVSLSQAADGDALGIQVPASSDLGFVEPTTVTAQWPLDSQARWTVDGMIAAQVSLAPVPTLTLGPGEGPALALDLMVPPNGYRNDVLHGLYVTNLGSATPSDLGRVELWKDGGDGIFSAGGDDVSLGVMVPQSGGWQTPLLATAVSSPGVRLFVGVTVSATPAESVTVQLSVPVNGIQFDSGDDGPLDAAIVNPDGLLVSGAPLLAMLECPSASTLGQDVVVRMRIRNIGSERVDSIVPSALEITGPAALTLASGPIPASLALDPGAADTVTWHYVATAVGETRFVASASGVGFPSGLVRRAPSAASAIHRVFAAASRLDLEPVQTMPTSVNPGETGIVPFSLTFTNPGGPGVSDVRLRGLHVQLVTEAGAPIVPSSLISRVSVHEGTNEYLVRTTVESAGNDLDLTLATPLRITGSEPATLSLRFDLLSTTVVPTFRLVIPDSTYFTAEDATSLGPVTVGVASGGYPLISNAARVVAPATDVDVTVAAVDTLRVARGATAVTMMRVTFLDRGAASVTSDARVAGFRVEVRDSADQAVPAGSRLLALRVVQPGRVLASVSVSPSSGPQVDVALSPPLNLPADSPVEVTIEADLASNAVLGRFRLAMVDTHRVDAYDANTHSPLLVHFDPDPLGGGWRTIEADAETLWVAHTPKIPSMLMIGQAGVSVLEIALHHPEPPGTARIRIDSLTVVLRDEQHRPLAASSYLDRVRVTRGGVDVADVTNLPGSSTFGVPLPGLLLEPGEISRLDLLVDVDAAAPIGSIELSIPASGFQAVDANSQRPILVLAEPGFELPALSGVGRVVSPSRELVVGFSSRMPAVVAADGRSMDAGELALSNRDPEGVGDILVDRLRIRASDSEYRAVPLGMWAERVEAWSNGALWATSGPIPSDSSTALLLAGQALAISKDETERIELRWVARSGAPGGRVRLGLDRVDVGVVQPGSALLAVQVLPENGQSFPMWTETGGLSPTDLAASYTNFPNPFAAGREPTSFAYYLPADGRVWLRIVTARGDPVATLVDGAWRGSGQHQSDAWDGRNGRGLVVLNGVYVAELTVRFDDGTGARCMRKVAVVR